MCVCVYLLTSFVILPLPQPYPIHTKQTHKHTNKKQYLVTRNVPCPTRASTLENSVATGGDGYEEEGEACDDGEDWLLSKVFTPEEQQRRMDEQIEQEFDILDEDGETVDGNEDAVVGGDGNADGGSENVQEGMAKLNMEERPVEAAATTTAAAGKEEEDDEYADMEEFEDEEVMEDEAAVPTSTATHTTSTTATNNIMKVRTYDLSITYDKYYQTPRVWMIGYASSDSSQPLTGTQMFEDVMSDYANRTVTIDPHPHIAGPHASIHPCQHGAVMKTIVRNLIKNAGSGSGSGGEEEEQAKPPSVEMYLFIFLKFVSSIIPTIHYDFTMDVAVSTRK